MTLADYSAATLVCTPLSSPPCAHRSGAVRGQSLVEFALVFPLICFLVAATVEVGSAFNASITVTNAARDAARHGLNMTNSAICNLVMAQSQRLPGQKQVVITRTKDTATVNNQTVDTVDGSCTCIDGLVTGTSGGHLVRSASPERALEVEVRYTHALLLGLDIAPFPSTMGMRSSAKFPVAPYYNNWDTTSTC